MKFKCDRCGNEDPSFKSMKHCCWFYYFKSTGQDPHLPKGEKMPKRKLKVGDIVYSKFFDANIEIVKINSDRDWLFKLNNRILQAKTPLSYFEKQ